MNTITSGQILAIVRTMLKLNQSDIAAHLGLQRTAVSMLENGHRQIRDEHRERLRMINIDLDDPALLAAVTKLYDAVNRRTAAQPESRADTHRTETRMND